MRYFLTECFFLLGLTCITFASQDTLKAAILSIIGIFCLIIYGTIQGNNKS